MVVILGVFAGRFGHLFHSQVKASQTFNFQTTKKLFLLVNGLMDWGLCKFILVSSQYKFYYFFIYLKLGWPWTHVFICHHSKNMYLIIWPRTLNLHKELRYFFFLSKRPKGGHYGNKDTMSLLLSPAIYFGSILYVYISIFIFNCNLFI